MSKRQGLYWFFAFLAVVLLLGFSCYRDGHSLTRACLAAGGVRMDIGTGNTACVRVDVQQIPVPLK